jgi:glycosyltransferase involved in cell wall biosynthesis
MPEVSVVMTVFNGEQYVAEAVESILAQTYRDFELIVVDNFSTDRTYEILTSYKDPRMTVIRNPANLGQTRALNVGVRAARGRYIARMDADDVAFPERLAVQYAFLEKHPEIAVVGSATLDMDRHGKPLRTYKVPTDPLTLKCYLAGSGELTAWCVTHPTVMMRKSALEDVGLYRDENGSLEGYPQDYELWGLLARKYEFANIERPLVKYRLLPKSASRNARNERDKAVFERYCAAITLEKIRFYLSNLACEDAERLMRMLEFQPQEAGRDGAKVFEIFDRYLDRVTEKAAAKRRVEFLKNRMKLYYLPQSFVTHKMQCVREFFRLMGRDPSALFDGRFYRKIMKVFLSRVLPGRGYHLFTKEILCYR